MVYAAKIKSGKVELYDANTGSFIRSVGNGNVSNANVQGNVLSITYLDGKVEIYDADNGSYKRTI